MKIKTMCKETVKGYEVPRKLIYDGKTLTIKTPLSKTKDVCIPVESIRECSYDCETGFTQKSKSVIGRAIAGGLLFGGVGAVVGGMTGIGQKTEKVKRFFFAVAYTDGSESTVRVFDDYPSSKTYKIANAFNKKHGER